jgi:hypothetical protein
MGQYSLLKRQSSPRFDYRDYEFLRCCSNDCHSAVFVSRYRCAEV